MTTPPSFSCFFCCQHLLPYRNSFSGNLLLVLLTFSCYILSVIFSPWLYCLCHFETLLVFYFKGFNAAVGGCFFAVESVLWPSPAESSLYLTNTTSMVILSAVIASVVSEIGLGSEPAFAVPGYDFRTPTGLQYGTDNWWRT
uniref:Uncharacterized protein n=1 Tax=Nicotiana tabacum TaxID=4097 RepID=A0A1S4B7I3_TOBAC|nr:PREDICTED: uncharacterized protein LOC107805388 [Nicotiana tabacum]